MNNGYVRQRRNLISICVFISLAILGGAKMNPYFPYHIDRPYVAEIFMWLGYAYFWYRVLIYQPDNLANLFKNEIILNHIKEHDASYYSEYNLVTFYGDITVEETNDNKTKFIFNGTNAAEGSMPPSFVETSMNYDSVINFKNKAKNCIKGKVVTDYFLPHVLAIIILFIGVYKYCVVV